ncbi:MAG: hypothetical protein CMJ58_15585 [Planctomycetaceae bacterium]|nr:hypothetical protein [Planctomycetaceae bacterium]
MAAYKRSRTQQILAVAVVAAAALLKLWLDQYDEHGNRRPARSEGGPVAAPSAPGELQELRVERVVDGDTLLLEPDHTRARLQGIDTPETVKEDTPVQKWGPEATQYTKDFIRGAGGRVQIEVDGEYADQYGRRLVFVWNGDRLLNEELVREGLARPKLAYDYSQAKKDRLKAAQRDAQRARRGLWSD